MCRLSCILPPFALVHPSETIIKKVFHFSSVLLLLFYYSIIVIIIIIIIIIIDYYQCLPVHFSFASRNACLFIVRM